MTGVPPLAPEQLYRSVAPAALAFATTADLPDLLEFVGQDRAGRALNLGVRVRHYGYNIFALGLSGTGKMTLVSRHVQERAAAEPPPSDWCYVYNFDLPSQPRALKLPPGTGKRLRADMDRFAEDLRSGLSAAFESEEIQSRRQRLAEEFQERQQASLTELQEKARARNLALLRTPAGLAFAPLREGEVLPPEEFAKLPEAEQTAVKAEVESLQQELQRVLFKVPGWERELRDRMRELHREITTFVLNDIMNELLERYREFPQVIAHLQAVQNDVVEHVLEFLSSGDQPEDEGDGRPQFFAGKATPRRYQVNVLVDADGATGAPVVYESNPSFGNLVGRVEHQAQMGALLTDFTLIKPGCLHRANGGYLILDAMRLLSAPYAWEGLKRALQFNQIKIESPLEMMNLATTVSLEPEPIPCDVKVVLIGDRSLYYLLSAYDRDFNELFKISADFDDELERTPETEATYAHLIATVARREGVRPLDASAVARIIERSARLADDSERLTTQIERIIGLMQEADFWAAQAGAGVIAAAHVEQAVAAQVDRNSRVEDRLRDAVLRDTILIDTAGERTGQVNGLAVTQLGAHAFGFPTRITVTIRLGRGEVVDIEREAEMSGPIHAKGVLILSSFLRARYARHAPLSLGASLVFEQSYSGVEGDSASSAELYALLSAISGAPIRQSLAVTGSVNQLGQVQAIGGANEKIEGFFDLCAARGLTGDQGVLIPAANVKHLMLDQAVVDAVRAGKFAIYPIATVDEGIEVLTGVPAGAPDAAGNYPPDSINGRVAARLAAMNEERRRAEADLDAGADDAAGSSRKRKKKTTL